jgi:hypothetical protein
MPEKTSESDLTNRIVNLERKVDLIENKISINIKYYVSNLIELKNKFEKYIIDNYSLKRMAEMDEKQPYEDYSDFINWNINCINELSKEDQEWLYNLCLKINDNKINLMDEESCSVFIASKIFFTPYKKLCIMNPR